MGAGQAERKVQEMFCYRALDETGGFDFELQKER